MAYKPLWDWMDKHEGKKEGSSFEALQKERERQEVKKKLAQKMKSPKNMKLADKFRKNRPGIFPKEYK